MSDNKSYASMNINWADLIYGNSLESVDVLTFLKKAYYIFN